VLIEVTPPYLGLKENQRRRDNPPETPGELIQYQCVIAARPESMGNFGILGTPWRGPNLRTANKVQREGVVWYDR